MNLTPRRSRRSFRRFPLQSLACLILLAAGPRAAAAPEIVLPPATFSHQGRLAINGVLVNGNRQFKFLLYHRTGTDPEITEQGIWSNFGDYEEMKEPEGSVTVAVTNGLYSVVLGDPDMMEPLPANFALPVDGKLFLRIWISGVEGDGFFPLAPDQEITAIPFALSALTVADNAVTSPKIVDGQVMTADIAELAVTAAKIADAAIDGGKIADGSLSGDDLAPGSVQNFHLAAGSVTSDKIADLAVTLADLGNGSVANPKLAANAVTGDKISDGTIALEDLAANAVNGNRVVDGSLGAADLGTGSVAGDEIADGTVGPADLAANSVGTLNLAPASITGAKMAAGSIDSSHLLDSSVGATDLQPGAVQESALDAAAVTTDKLAEASITFSKFHPDTIVALAGGVPDGGVTTLKLANSAVTADKLAAQSVTAAALAPGAVTGLDHPTAGQPRAMQALATGNVQIGAGFIADVGPPTMEGESLVVGGSHSLDIHRSLVAGNNHTVIGDEFMVAGHGHELFGARSLVAGADHTVQGENNLASGRNNAVTASESMAIGYDNTVLGNRSAAIGSGCRVENNAHHSVVLGLGNIAFAPETCVVGRYNADQEVLGMDAVFTVGDGDEFIRRNTLAVGTGGTLAIGAVTEMNGNSIMHENGARLTAGGAWTNSSDRALKENIRAVAAADVLERVAALPVSEWNYKAEDDAVRHIGPMAQDFHAAFQLGDSEKAISTVDASGVALVAIQALKRKSDEQAAALEARDQVIADLQARLERMERLLESTPNP
jgi:hypothetical protein